MALLLSCYVAKGKGNPTMVKFLTDQLSTVLVRLHYEKVRLNMRGRDAGLP